MYEMDAECVCGACKPKQRDSSRLTVTPQSSKINLLDSWLFTWPYNPNSRLQWESARHTVISKLYGAQNATAQSSPLVKYCAFELYNETVLIRKTTTLFVSSDTSKMFFLTAKHISMLFKCHKAS